MEIKTNSVIIDLEKYNALRDFQQNIMDGKIWVVNEYDNRNWISFTNQRKLYAFKTNDKVIDELVELNKTHAELIDKLRTELNSEISKNSNRESNLNSEKRFSEMNIMDFLKWKKRYLKSNK